MMKSCYFMAIYDYRQKQVFYFHILFAVVILVLLVPESGM